eukprot:CAMPEP_0176019492 /NCGR_PEP_ID=MMETSP0120_2-20121206/9418_1 /TAXON_ID=160619 /ORGANISM="Kryptoperidinium foliaceum, Strain CCMP 1326" /LENGTH=296 /DNA_ID=CAMNT_0017352569 /DNA_START=249 /DNA_END=1135 /DNA_ORIENTATION=+
MAPELIDVDCNLWHRDLKTLQGKDVDENDCWNILTEDAIKQANIVAMLSPSSTIDEAKNGLELIMNYPPPIRIKTTVGIHPYHVTDDGITGVPISEHRQTMQSLLRNDLVAAIGECGLDASEGFPHIEDQLPLFRLQVELANEFNLPLFVHERLAFDEALEILNKATTPVIIHCFTGTRDQCLEYVKRGYYISVSGYVLKETNDNYDEVISCLNEDTIPLSRLMIETDAPYMGFPGSRQLYLEHNDEFVSSLNSKKRKRLIQSTYPNVPSSLPSVLERVAQCYTEKNPDLSLETIA